MVFVSGNHLFNQDNVEFFVDDNVIKNVGNLEGVIKTTSSTVVNRDRKVKFPSGFACSLGKSTKKSKKFVLGGL